MGVLSGGHLEQVLGRRDLLRRDAVASVRLSPTMCTIVTSFSGICTPGAKLIEPLTPGKCSASSRAPAMSFCLAEFARSMAFATNITES